MKLKTNTQICPVCHMQVDTPTFEARYLDINYWYCTEQCKARFIANPGLYVGRPGEKSPKQKGVQVLKKRRIKLDSPITAATKTNILLMLFKIMGVKRVTVNKDSLVVEYDLLETTENHIVQELLTSELAVDDNFIERVKRTFTDFTEETQIANLEVPQHGGNTGGCH